MSNFICGLIKPFRPLILLLTWCASLHGAIAADNTHLQEILKSGVLHVGVQGALPPLAFRGSDGKLQGLEIDLAQDLATRLGVKMEPVIVESSNRMQFLQQGKIDVIVAAMYDTAERRKVVGIVYPDYYASGTTLLSRKSAKLSSWNDLRGKPVCVKQGVLLNRDMEEKYGAKLVAFTTTDETLQALRQGKCVGFEFDDNIIAGLLTKPEWSDYEAALPSIGVTPVGAAVPLADVDGALGNFVSGTIYNWFRTGMLTSLAKKWNMPQPAWLREQQAKFSE